MMGLLQPQPKPSTYAGPTKQIVLKMASQSHEKAKTPRSQTVSKRGQSVEVNKEKHQGIAHTQGARRACAHPRAAGRAALAVDQAPHKSTAAAAA
jgi:hypothetical protein